MGDKRKQYVLSYHPSPITYHLLRKIRAGFVVWLAGEILFPFFGREIAVADAAGVLKPRFQCHIPKDQRFVDAAGRQPTAIRTEGYILNRILQTDERLTDELASAYVPQENILMRKVFTQRG